MSATLDRARLHTFEHHWREEADAAFLYRALADTEHDERRRDLYRRLVGVEDRHVAIWEELLTGHGRPPAAFRPSLRARLLAWLGRGFGPGFLLMLQEQVQEELKIGERTMSPMREGWITGTATAFSAFIPVFPFLLFGGRTAIVVAFTVSMLSHFLGGAARSVFAGRDVFRSGFDMFVVGLGVAVIEYVVGEWVSRML